MQISINDLRSAYETLTTLSNVKFQASTSFKIARLLHKLDADYKASETAKNDILRDVGELQESGNHIIKSDDITRIAKFETHWKLIGDAVVEVQDTPSFNVSEFSEIEPRHFVALMSFITDDASQ